MGSAHPHLPLTLLCCRPQVDVHQNDINEATATGFAEMLMCNTSIVELNLDSNHLAGAAKHVAIALPLNSTLKKLHVADCWIEDKEAEMLLQALEKNTAITEFTGSNNRCDTKDVRRRLRTWAR
jgi:Ran GTPase-activating protein (RanGAP) involved in mRNA processing and transport